MLFFFVSLIAVQAAKIGSRYYPHEFLTIFDDGTLRFATEDELLHRRGSNEFEIDGNTIFPSRTQLNICRIHNRDQLVGCRGYDQFVDAHFVSWKIQFTTSDHEIQIRSPDNRCLEVLHNSEFGNDVALRSCLGSSDQLFTIFPGEYSWTVVNGLAHHRHHGYIDRHKYLLGPY